MAENTSSNGPGFFGNLLLGAGAMAGVNHVTDGAVTSVVNNVATSAGNALSGSSIGASTAPWLAGPAAPFATAAWSLWNGSAEMKERGLIGVTEKTALNYGIVGGLATAAGIMSAPAVGMALAVGGTLWGGKHLLRAGKEFASDPLGVLGNTLKKPFKWSGDALASLRGGTRSTPAHA